MRSLGHMNAARPADFPTIGSNATEAATVVGGRSDCGVVVLCDHASNALPPEYGTLGLPATEHERHISYDIGAAGVARALAARLGAPAVLARYSRLLIDPNRGEDDPTLIMRISDGAVVPGNRGVDSAEWERRVARYYRPYHASVGAVIERALTAGVAPVLVSIHSFTPVMKGVKRPWHAGILWDKDPRLAVPLLAHLRRDSGLVVGDNKPYSGVLKGDTLWQHGTRRGLAHAIIEIRQDLIGDERGQQAWGERIAVIVQDILADHASRERLLRIDVHGSHTDVS